MADEKLEKWNYWVVFSFLTPVGELRITGRLIERDRPIETYADIENLTTDGVFGDFKAITPINWMRME